MNLRACAYDPAVEVLLLGLTEMIELADDPLELVHGAHALIPINEWPPFAGRDLAALGAAMRVPVLVDEWNLFDHEPAQAAGITYVEVGR